MAEETSDFKGFGDYGRSTVSTNADDVIPAAALAPPAPPSTVDDVIPPHSLIATTQPGEISSGPMGFINGVSGLVGKTALNIPYAAASGVQDFYRMATGGDEKAPDSGLVDALHFPLNKNEQDVASAIGEQIKPLTDAVSTVAREDFPLPDSEKRVLKDVAQIVPLAGVGSNALRTLARTSEALPAAEAASSVSVPLAPKSFDSPPVEGGLPPEMAKDRAAVLSRVGIENARNSALIGDAKIGRDGFPAFQIR